MSEVTKNLRVLVVDDQEIFLQAVVDELNFLEFESFTAQDGQKGFELASATKFDLILSDIRMPNKDGRWFLNELRKTQISSPKFIFMTGFADLSIQDAYAMGADGFLAKPLHPDKFATILTKICRPNAIRWSEPPKEKIVHHLIKSVSYSSHNSTIPEILVGRGGFSLSIKNLVFKIGDIISFDIKFDAGPLQHLEGIGSIVWKEENQNNVGDKYGLYFDYLTPETLPAWLIYLQEREIIEVIPKGGLLETRQ